MHEYIRCTTLSVLGSLGVSCYILADTFFVSKGLGTNGLAALNLAIPVYNFIHGTGLMLGIGGATKFSIYRSQKQKEHVNQLYTNTLCLAVLFSTVFVLFGMFFSRHLAQILGGDDNILEMTDTYLKWLLIFSPAFILNDIFLCFVRNDESPQLSMMAMLIGSFSNIILDYIFIFPLRMGIFGAVFATGLSPVISMLMMLPHWLGKRNTFHVTRTKIRACVAMQTLSLGFPSLIAQLSSGIVMITFNAIILDLKGSTGIAAYGVIANISLVTVALYTGIAQGVQPLVSSFYGKGDSSQVRTVSKYAIATVLAVSCVVYLLIFIYSRQITAVFNSEKNMELYEIAVPGLRQYFLSSAFAGYNIILATLLTSIENALPSHILSLLRGLILIIPLTFLLSSLWGMTGVWLAYPITELLTALLGLIIVHPYAR